MGFLDNKERVIDMVLTEEGRRQFSLGELRCVYYSFFDDGVNYSPYISNSSSLSTLELSSSIENQIENTLVLEAVSGVSYHKTTETLGAMNSLFTMPQGQNVLSRVLLDPLIISGTITVEQNKLQEITLKKDKNGNVTSQIGPVDVGFKKKKTSSVTIDLDVADFFPQFMQEGFEITMFSSGSSGLVRMDAKRDSFEDDSYGSELKIFVDEKFRSLTKRK